MSIMQQANAVLNAMEQGKVEACIGYQEATHPEYTRIQLKESTWAMLETIGFDLEGIEYWTEYFFGEV